MRVLGGRDRGPHALGRSYEQQDLSLPNESRTSLNAKM